EIEAITQFIIEQAAENVEFPNSAAVDYLHAVGLLSFSYMFAKSRISVMYSAMNAPPHLMVLRPIKS
ncbi:hypothetical protein IAF28_21010, partial [Acinetobacter baumannii]|nr:hypothetical protein [Acinetobacter baumannii]